MACHLAIELSSIPVELRALVCDYAEIFSLQQPTANQLSRFDQIIEQSCEDSRLHFWLSEVEHILGHHLGYFEDDLKQQYMNQKAKRREHFVDTDTSVNESGVS